MLSVLKCSVSLKACLSVFAARNLNKALLPLFFVLLGCDADGFIGSEESARNEIPLQVPQKLRQAQAINLNQVTVSVTLRGETIPVNGANGRWSIAIDRDTYPGVSALTVRYFEQIDGNPLLLAEFNGSITMSDTASSIEPVGTMSENFDNDGDNFTNLAERSENPPTDPLDSSSYPTPGLFVSDLSGQPANQVTGTLLATFRNFDSLGTTTVNSVRVATVDYGSQRTFQDNIDYYSSVYDYDACTVSQATTGGGGGGGTGTGDGGGGVPYVAAGNTVTINTPSGTWLNIPQTSTGLYELEDLPSLPANATLSIPGNGFPSVGSYTLVKPAPLVRILPRADRSVTVNSEYSWIPGTGAGSSVVLNFYELDGAGDFVRWLAFCDVLDDGQFELPDSVINAISNSPNAIRVRYDRSARRLEVIDGINFYQRITVSEDVS